MLSVELGSDGIEQHHELVTTHSGGGVPLPHDGCDALARGPQHHVAGRMAPGVVHGLEPIQIDAADGGDVTIAGDAGERGLQRGAQVGPVRQPGEVVVGSQVRELLDDRIAVGHIAPGDDQGGDAVVVQVVAPDELVATPAAVHIEQSGGGGLGGEAPLHPIEEPEHLRPILGVHVGQQLPAEILDIRCDIEHALHRWRDEHHAPGLVEHQVQVGGVFEQRPVAVERRPKRAGERPVGQLLLHQGGDVTQAADGALGGAAHTGIEHADRSDHPTAGVADGHAGERADRLLAPDERAALEAGVGAHVGHQQRVLLWFAHDEEAQHRILPHPGGAHAAAGHRPPTAAFAQADGGHRRPEGGGRQRRQPGQAGQPPSIVGRSRFRAVATHRQLREHLRFRR
ncbi:MAG: hypothetical protein R2755_19310 [Acidimicrobiales bacterium]